MNSTHFKSAIISAVGFAVAFVVNSYAPQVIEAYPIAGPAITALGAWLSNLVYKNGWLNGLLKPDQKTDETKTDPVVTPVVPVIPPIPGPKNDLLATIAALLLDRLAKRDRNGIDQALELYERVADDAEEA